MSTASCIGCGLRSSTIGNLFDNKKEHDLWPLVPMGEEIMTYAEERDHYHHQPQHRRILSDPPHPIDYVRIYGIKRLLCLYQLPY
jgi:hypothetical protein